jgi:hypothetical protein
VKRRRDGQMMVRWCAAGMAEASKRFRHVNGLLRGVRDALNPTRRRVTPKIDG